MKANAGEGAAGDAAALKSRLKVKAKKPDMTVQLAVCGLALSNAQKQQFKDGTVKVFGQVKIGPYLLTPGKPCAVVYDATIKEAVAKGLIVNMGVKPK